MKVNQRPSVHAWMVNAPSVLSLAACALHLLPELLLGRLRLDYCENLYDLNIIFVYICYIYLSFSCKTCSTYEKSEKIEDISNL